ncbi:MAG: DUF3619 family protein [Bacteroidales bacterium]|nr:DUF3619 family protein [Bacteroidales bacterium]
MDKLEHNLRQQLRAAESQLDDNTARRLRQARSTALASSRRPLLSRLMVPALGMATASVVALVLVLSPGEPGQDILDNASFYQDLDFYNWLAENDATWKS